MSLYLGLLDSLSDSDRASAGDRPVPESDADLVCPLGRNVDVDEQVVVAILVVLVFGVTKVAWVFNEKAVTLVERVVFLVAELELVVELIPVATGREEVKLDSSSLEFEVDDNQEYVDRE